MVAVDGRTRAAAELELRQPLRIVALEDYPQASFEVAKGPDAARPVDRLRGLKRGERSLAGSLENHIPTFRLGLHLRNRLIFLVDAKGRGLRLADFIAESAENRSPRQTGSTF